MSVTITGTQLATRVLKRIGKLGAGQAANGDDLVDVLEQINAFVGMLNQQDLALAVTLRIPFGLAAGVGTYTIGAIEDSPALLAQRPTHIDAAGRIMAGQTFETPIDVWSRAQWEAEPWKDREGPFEAVHYEPTVPKGTVYLVPVPSTADTLVLYYKTTLTAFTADVGVVLDDGYDLMLELMVARLVAPLYGTQLDPDSKQMAIEALATLKQANEDVPLLAVDAALLSNSGPYDIRKG
jgi:hypothetical protein